MEFDSSSTESKGGGRNWDRVAAVSGVVVFVVLLVLALVFGVVSVLRVVRGAGGPPYPVTSVTDAAPGEVVRLGHGRPNHLAYSPDGQHLAVASSVGVWVYATDIDDEGRLLQSAGEWVDNVSWSPDGRTLAVSADGIHLLSVEGDEVIRTLEKSDENVLEQHVSWSPDGRFVAAAVDDWPRYELRLWTVENGRLIQRIRYEDGAEAVSWSPDGRQLALATGTKVVIHTPLTEPEEAIVIDEVPEYLEAVSWSPDGSMIAAASLYRVDIWSLAEERVLPIADNFGGYLASISWSPDSRLLAVGGDNPVVSIWNTEGDLVKELAEEGHWAELVSWSPNGGQLAIGREGDGTVELWDVEEGQLVRYLGEGTGWAESVSWSPDGSMVAVGGHNRQVLLWSVAEGQFVQKFGKSNPGFQQAQASWSPDVSMVAIQGGGEPDNTIKVWSVAEDALLLDLKLDNVVDVVVWSPNANLLAIGQEGDVELWSVPEGRLVRTLSGDVGAINSISWSPDGTKVAAGTGRWEERGGAFNSVSIGLVALWRVEDGELLHVLAEDNMETVRSVAWSPDNRQVAAVADVPAKGRFIGPYGFCGVWIWNTEQGELHQELPPQPGHCWTLDWSVNNLIAYGAGTDVLIASPNGEILRGLAGRNGVVESVSWSPDGSQLASAGYGGAVFVWQEKAVKQWTGKSNND
jgi:WD40 repeat protein